MFFLLRWPELAAWQQWSKGLFYLDNVGGINFLTMILCVVGEAAWCVETIGHALVIFLDFRETVSIATHRPSIHHSDRPHLTSGSCIHSACCKSLNSSQDVSFSKMARVGGLTTMKQRGFLYGHCRQQQWSKGLFYMDNVGRQHPRWYCAWAAGSINFLTMILCVVGEAA